MKTTRRGLFSYLLVISGLCLVAWAASAMPKAPRPEVLVPIEPPPPMAPPKPPQVTQIPKERPRIEVIFALDTTGSMSGLIDGAKRKIWSIANYIAQGQPKPEVRIGLVAYRDRGDAYVTRFYDLSDDLDQVFQHLSTFQADGGGDGPEHVAAALHDAVYRASWSDDQKTLKQIYLVGDAPPHTDYGDFDYRKIARVAHDRNIHVNTIRCGGDQETKRVWSEIATLAAGDFASIDQSGGVLAVATPFDSKLAELNAKLVRTAVGYGAGGAALRRKAADALAAPTEVAADRAGYFASSGRGAVGGDGDLVRDAAEGKVDVAAVPAAELPAPMQAMAPAKRKAFIEEKQAEREEVAKEIGELNKKRNEFLKGRNRADAFDAKVLGTIKDQAASVGVRY